MVARTTPVGTAVAGQQAPAATMNGAAGGWLGYVQATATQGSITTQVDVTGLSVAVTVGTSRRIKITLCLPSMQSTTGGDIGVGYIMEGATQLQAVGDALLSTAGLTVVGYVVLAPSAGVHTYKAQASRVGGGTLSLNATATQPMFLLVEDIGPQ